MDAELRRDADEVLVERHDRGSKQRLRPFETTGSPHVKRTKQRARDREPATAVQIARDGNLEVATATHELREIECGEGRFER